MKKGDSPMNIHPRLLDGNLTLLKPGEKIVITISDKNPNHVRIIDFMEEEDARTKGTA